MHLTKKAPGTWSNLALVGSFLVGVLFHRNASAAKSFLSNSFRQFEKLEIKSKPFSKRNKLNNGKKTATKLKTEKEEFDVNILFMN